MLRSKTILVTGGAGSLGHFVARALLGSGVKYYGSLDHLMGLEAIRTLIASADREQTEPDRLLDFME